MKVPEIVDAIIKDNPELLGEVQKKQAINLVRQVFRQIVKTLDKLEGQNEVVTISGLGSFRNRIVEREREGRMVLENRIIFHSAPNTLENTGKIR